MLKVGQKLYQIDNVLVKLVEYEVVKQPTIHKDWFYIKNNVDGYPEFQAFYKINQVVSDNSVQIREIDEKGFSRQLSNWQHLGRTPQQAIKIYRQKKQDNIDRCIDKLSEENIKLKLLIHLENSIQD